MFHKQNSFCRTKFYGQRLQKTWISFTDFFLFLLQKLFSTYLWVRPVYISRFSSGRDKHWTRSTRITDLNKNEWVFKNGWYGSSLFSCSNQLPKLIQSDFCLCRFCSFGYTWRCTKITDPRSFHVPPCLSNLRTRRRGRNLNNLKERKINYWQLC